MELFTLLENSFEEMVAIRRFLHQHPEESFKETKTAAYIADFYRKLGIPVRTNVGGNGVVATIQGALSGETVALRADFDALPIQDEKDVAYKSTVPGVMHACGHDGHTATLLVLSKALFQLRSQLKGRIVLIHQHAEEYAPGGAKPMIEDGCLDGVDVIFGTHLWATTPTGTIEYRTGPIMAAADRFEINIQGQGGHGGMPHKAKDAILTASQLVIALQQIVSRRVDPLESAVVSVGTFVSENSFNIIAERAKIIGTVRTFSEDIQSLIEKEIERITQGICFAADTTYTYSYSRGYPPVITHKAETEFFTRSASSIPDVKVIEEIEPKMIGEDFSYYLQHVKGTFFFTGAKAEGVKAYPHHHPRFDFDENAMLIAAKTLGKAAIEYNK